ATIETQARQEGQGLFVDGARVDFHTQLGVGREFEVAASGVHQRRQFVAAHEGGRAPAQVQLHGASILAQVRGEQVHFLADVVDILLRTAGVLRDDLVAGAEVAQRTTERQVEIDGERRVAGRL